MKLTPEQLKTYTDDPIASDPLVRKWCKLPEDRYFTVAIWPESVAGEVRISNRSRTVHAVKISKSS